MFSHCLLEDYLSLSFARGCRRLLWFVLLLGRKDCTFLSPGGYGLVSGVLWACSFLPRRESLAKTLPFALEHKVKMSAGPRGISRDFQKLFWTRTQTIPQHLCILKLLVDVKGLFWVCVNASVKWELCSRMMYMLWGNLWVSLFRVCKGCKLSCRIETLLLFGDF